MSEHSKQSAIKYVDGQIAYWQKIKSQIEVLPKEVIDVLIGNGVGKMTGNTAESQEREAGSHIQAVRELLIAASKNGLRKSDILDGFPNAKSYDEGILYNIVTNALSSLKKGDEIEKYKPTDVKMRGYYWRMKNR